MMFRILEAFYRALDRWAQEVKDREIEADREYLKRHGTMAEQAIASCGHRDTNLG